MQCYLKRFKYIFTIIIYLILSGCSPYPEPESNTPVTNNTSVMNNTTEYAHKYAVLISAFEVPEGADNVHLKCEFWYDLVWQYNILKDNGFDDDKIYVLYGKGADFATTVDRYKPRNSITDWEVSKAKIEWVFKNKLNALTENDLLYIWWMGHGELNGSDPCSLFMPIITLGYVDPNNIVLDTNLRDYLSWVKYKRCILTVMTCHSGGIIDNMSNNKTITLTSATCEESSDDADSTCDGDFHAEFNYTLSNALRKKDPCGSRISSDRNRDGRVSLREAYKYIKSNMRTSHPKRRDPGGIYSSTYLN